MTTANISRTDYLGFAGLALMAAGVAGTLAAIVITRDFWPICIVGLSTQAAATGLGIAGWRSPGGKAATIVGGLLLALLLSYVGFVAAIVISGAYGAPF